jgi:hypothetical protein
MHSCRQQAWAKEHLVGHSCEVKMKRTFDWAANQLLLVLFGTALGLVPSSAVFGDIITQWNFNTGIGITPNIGVGSALLVGATTAGFAGGNVNGGSSDSDATASDQAWNISTFNNPASLKVYSLESARWDTRISQFHGMYGNPTPQVDFQQCSFPLMVERFGLLL